MIEEELKFKLKEKLKRKGKITLLVGAGLSAESGIPTFRDIDGYWTEGSENYTPQEMATFSMFSHNPNLVWGWYLYRYKICNQAAPNAGHYAIKEIQELFPDRFALISQNVDGLHSKTAMDESQHYLIHGDINKMRCSANCTSEIYTIPIAFDKLQFEAIF